MSETREAIRSWLRGRESLGEPELFVPEGARAEVIERLRAAGVDRAARPERLLRQ